MMVRGGGGNSVGERIVQEEIVVLHGDLPAVFFQFGVGIHRGPHVVWPRVKI